MRKSGTGADFALREGGSLRLRGLIGHVDVEPLTVPRSLWKLESKFPGMQIRTATDAEPSPIPRQRFILRWETLPANRDKPRDKPWPEPSMLRVMELRDLPAAPQ